MNESPIRIVTNEPSIGADGLMQSSTIYMIGQPLPQPLGEGPEPLRIVDVYEEVFQAAAEESDDQEEAAETETVTSGEFVILSLGEPNSVYVERGNGIVTRIPSRLIVRRDSSVPAEEIVAMLQQRQADAAEQAAAQAQAYAEQEQAYAQAQAEEQAQAQAAAQAQADADAQAAYDRSQAAQLLAQPPAVEQGGPSAQDGGI